MKKIKKGIGKVIPLSATKFLYKYHKKEIDKNLKRVLNSGWYILGQENKKLEEKLANYLNSKKVITVASGTDALTLAIKSLNLKGDAEVILPANVYPSVFGVSLAGVKVKLADVDQKTLNISVEEVRKLVNEKTKAVVVVHLYGNPVDISPIQKFTKEKGIYLIEDCAQAIGAKYKGKKVGTFGDLGIFSFYPTKNLAAFGDGGAIAVNNIKLLEKIRLLKMYGEKNRYESIMLGHNSRFDEIQAAILLAQLSKLERLNTKRAKIAKEYKKNLSNLPLDFIDEVKFGECVYHLFPILLDKRDNLAQFLKKKNIETSVHYPKPIHLTQTFINLGYEVGDFPVSEAASKRILSIPIHPFLTLKEVRYISASIGEFFYQRNS